MIYKSKDAEFNYFIGEKYKFTPDGEELTLVKVEGFNFIFEPYHWCTDIVFADLIRCKTNTIVCDGTQRQLF